MRVYLAAPMSGKEHANLPAILEARDALVREGHEVILPKDVDAPEMAERLYGGVHEPTDQEWIDLLADDLREIVRSKAEAIVCLPGWEYSGGVRLETWFAHHLRGLPIYDFHTGFPTHPLSESWLDYVHTRHADR